ncbi:hypothetical protein EVAR_100309_1 [Eumeta japonica]|uniref:Uncharacterized protein n=1 Tax=Eumeta variegata TaxID=151549 RepID=A0A4C1ZYP1_EUMVA|nr:hypothetical protein EVAR_100309_1 [Eumeta japonica]
MEVLIKNISHVRADKAQLGRQSAPPPRVPRPAPRPRAANHAFNLPLIAIPAFCYITTDYRPAYEFLHSGNISNAIRQLESLQLSSPIYSSKDCGFLEKFCFNCHTTPKFFFIITFLRDKRACEPPNTRNSTKVTKKSVSKAGPGFKLTTTDAKEEGIHSMFVLAELRTLIILASHPQERAEQRLPGQVIRRRLWNGRRTSRVKYLESPKAFGGHKGVVSLAKRRTPIPGAHLIGAQSECVRSRAA